MQKNSLLDTIKYDIPKIAIFPKSCCKCTNSIDTFEIFYYYNMHIKSKCEMIISYDAPICAKCRKEILYDKQED